MAKPMPSRMMKMATRYGQINGAVHIIPIPSRIMKIPTTVMIQFMPFNPHY
jgi:hypothetical protein